MIMQGVIKIFLFFFFCSLAWAQDDDFSLQNVIEKKANECRGLSARESSPTIILLSCIDVVVSIDSMLEGLPQPTMNLAFVGRSGHAYMPGIAPDSIADPDDRAAYEKALKQNAKNIDIFNKFGDLRKEFVSKIDMLLVDLPNAERRYAEQILRGLRMMAK